jgi:hypothetical protein
MQQHQNFERTTPKAKNPFGGHRWEADIKVVRDK